VVNIRLKHNINRKDTVRGSLIQKRKWSCAYCYVYVKLPL